MARTAPRTVQCIKLGHEAEGLAFPPIPGPLGQRVFENVSQEAWQGWIRYQTMLINENRLSLADQRARQYLFQQLEAYFFGAGADKPSGYVPPDDQDAGADTPSGNVPPDNP